MVSNLLIGAESQTTTWIFVALLVVLVVVLLVVPMFTNKKRAKQTTEMHNSLRAGDVIKTVGGIIGTIKEIRQVSPVDKEMVIETGDGDNKTTMVFDIQALYQIISRSSTPVETVFDDKISETESEKTEEDPVKAEIDEEKPTEADAAVVEKQSEPATEEAATETASVDTQVAAEEKPAETAQKPKAASPAKKKPVNSNKSSSKSSTKK